MSARIDKLTAAILSGDEEDVRTAVAALTAEDRRALPSEFMALDAQTKGHIRYSLQEVPAIVNDLAKGLGYSPFIAKVAMTPILAPFPAVPHPAFGVAPVPPADIPVAQQPAATGAAAPFNPLRAAAQNLGLSNVRASGNYATGINEDGQQVTVYSEAGRVHAFNTATQRYMGTVDIATAPAPSAAAVAASIPLPRARPSPAVVAANVPVPRPRPGMQQEALPPLPRSRPVLPQPAIEPASVPLPQARPSGDSSRTVNPVRTQPFTGDHGIERQLSGAMFDDRPMTGGIASEDDDALFFDPTRTEAPPPRPRARPAVSTEEEDEPDTPLPRARPTMQTMQQRAAGWDYFQAPRPTVADAAQQAIEQATSTQPRITTVRATPTPPADIGTGGRAAVRYHNQGAGKVRTQPIDSALEGRLSTAVEHFFGPGHEIHVTSGGQPTAAEGGARTGSTRHDHGQAADIYIIGPNGNRVDGLAHASFGRYWIENGWGSAAAGMDGNPANLHIDVHTDRALTWDYSGLTAEQRAILQGTAPLAYQPVSPGAPGAVASAGGDALTSLGSYVSRGGGLRFGSRGESVRQLQDSLRAAGYDPGVSDGIYGRQTQDAVRRMQASTGGDLAVDGVFGPRSYAAMVRDRDFQTLMADPRTTGELVPSLPASVAASMPSWGAMNPAPMSVRAQTLQAAQSFGRNLAHPLTGQPMRVASAGGVASAIPSMVTGYSRTSSVASPSMPGSQSMRFSPGRGIGMQVENSIMRPHDPANFGRLGTIEQMRELDSTLTASSALARSIRDRNRGLGPNSFSAFSDVADRGFGVDVRGWVEDYDPAIHGTSGGVGSYQAAGWNPAYGSGWDIGTSGGRTEAAGTTTGTGRAAAPGSSWYESDNRVSNRDEGVATREEAGWNDDYGSGWSI